MPRAMALSQMMFMLIYAGVLLIALRGNEARLLTPQLFASGLGEMIELAYKRYRARLPASLEEILALRPPGLASLRGRA